MRNILLSIVSLLVLLPVAAHAGSETVSARANKTNAIGGLTIYDENTCRHGGRVEHRINKKPAHGKVTVRYDSITLNKSAGKCAGRKAGATVVLYTPDRGYRGKDELSVTFSFPKYVGNHAGFRNAKKYTYKITVK